MAFQAFRTTAHVGNRLAEVHDKAWKDLQGWGSKVTDVTHTRIIVWHKGMHTRMRVGVCVRVCVCVCVCVCVACGCQTRILWLRWQLHSNLSQSSPKYRP